ncbi:MAG TPA: carboxypeptidase-like regulatory domain-containing protein [Solirubrobacteraceae bacterium]
MFWMRNTTGRSTLVAVAMATLCALAVAGGAARSAQAGEYHVYSCRMPDGEVAPADGWSEMKSNTSDSLEDTCPTDGALVVGLNDGETHEVEKDSGSWVFSAPTGSIIAAAKLWRAGDADGGWATNATYEFWLAGPENQDVEADVIDQCVAEFGCPTGVGSTTSAMSPSNLVTVLPENLGAHLYVNVSCGGSAKFVCPSGKGDSDGYAAVVYLYAADLTLEQTSQPTVSDVEGELASAATLTGTADLSLHAQDSGSGVYQAVFTVDGVELGRTVLDENSGRCHDVGQTSDGLPAFLYLQPCPSSVSADLPLDTTTLTDGPHHLVVTVTNAAGNSTVALDRKITVLNDPPASPPVSSPPSQAPPSTVQNDPSPNPNPSPSPLTLANPTPTTQPLSANGTNGSAVAALRVHWAATARATLAGSYGHAQTVIGQLTAPGGMPIAGALVQMFDTPAYERAPTRTLASLRTAANGSFRLRLPAGTPSGRITVAYSSHAGQAVPDITAALSLTIPASLALSVTPRSTSVGGTIVFHGTLRGAPLPPGGKQLVLEARTLGGSWRQFQVLATGAHGRYRATYRFRLAGPISYQFRALSPREADFPYGVGSSNVVLVHER